MSNVYGNVVEVDVYGDGKYRDIKTGFVIDSDLKFYGVSPDKVTTNALNKIEQGRVMGFNVS